MGGESPVVNAPHPQEVGSPDTFTPGADISGYYQIFYVGTNMNPEVLRLVPSASVPEASSILLLGFMGAVLGLGRKLRRL